ncbi:MAG: hypothetical protein ACREP9_19805 [Candidatus Dormibacteraceae bacterium]
MIPAITAGPAVLYLGDAREVQEELPSAPVQGCLTSPPYWVMESIQGQNTAFYRAAEGFGQMIEISEQMKTPSVPAASIVAPDEFECRQCGLRLTPSKPGQPGPRASFCSPACREAARLRREQGLPESTLRVRPGGRRRLRERLITEEVI